MAESFSNSLTRAAGIVTTSSSGSIGITTNLITGISTALVNVGDLKILTSDKVNLETLSSSGLIRSNSKSVKLLGAGETTKAFEVEVNFASASAIKKIEAAGGSVKTS